MALVKPSWMAGPPGYYRAAIRLGTKVIWHCEHDHGYRDYAPIAGYLSALDCARSMLGLQVRAVFGPAILDLADASAERLEAAEAALTESTRNFEAAGFPLASELAHTTTTAHHVVAHLRALLAQRDYVKATRAGWSEKTRAIVSAGKIVDSNAIPWS